MSYFVFQSSVLLLGAYFLGTSFGCMFRSLMFDSREASSVRAGGSEEAAVAPPNVAPNVAPDVPAPQKAPAPQVDPVSQEAAQAAAPIARTGVSSDSVAGSAAAMAAATVAAATAQVATPEGGAMASSAAEAAASAAQNHGDSDQAADVAETVPETASEPASETPKIILPTSAALATAAAAAAAATATSSSGTNEVATSSTTSGAASGSTSGSTAPAASVAAEGDDDLKRIQGIGPEVESVLHNNGITEYRQIANWSAADIERFSVDLNFSDRVSRENWIEQAQILASGGSTKYSDRIDRGEIAVDNISDKDDGSDGNDGGPTSGPTSGATGGGAGGTPSGGSLGMSAAAGAVAAATGGASIPALSSGTVATTDLSIAASAAAASTVMASNTSASVLPSMLESDQAIRIIGDAPGIVDDLKQIKGIGLGLEEKLNSAGVTSFGQIAAWSTSDINEMSKLLSFQGRIERENWVEQAQVLASGGQTDFSKRVERGDVQPGLNGTA